MVVFSLTLVRHGETLANRQKIIQGQTNTPLSDVGREQARLVAERLRYEHFTHVFASDLVRAAHTAQAIIDANTTSQCTIQFDKRLRERKYGIVEGKSLKELAVAARKENVSIPNYTPYGAETIEQMRSRAKTFFQDLCKLVITDSLSMETNYIPASLKQRVRSFGFSSSEPVMDPSASAEKSKLGEFSALPKQRSMSAVDYPGGDGPQERREPFPQVGDAQRGLVHTPAALSHAKAGGDQIPPGVKTARTVCSRCGEKRQLDKSEEEICVMCKDSNSASDDLSKRPRHDNSKSSFLHQHRADSNLPETFLNNDSSRQSSVQHPYVPLPSDSSTVSSKKYSEHDEFPDKDVSRNKVSDINNDCMFHPSADIHTVIHTSVVSDVNVVNGNISNDEVSCSVNRAKCDVSEDCSDVAISDSCHPICTSDTCVVNAKEQKHSRLNDKAGYFCQEESVPSSKNCAHSLELTSSCSAHSISHNSKSNDDVCEDSEEFQNSASGASSRPVFYLAGENNHAAVKFSAESLIACNFSQGLRTAGNFSGKFRLDGEFSPEDGKMQAPSKTPSHSRLSSFSNGVLPSDSESHSCAGSPEAFVGRGKDAIRFPSRNDSKLPPTSAVRRDDARVSPAPVPSQLRSPCPRTFGAVEEVRPPWAGAPDEDNVFPPLPVDVEQQTSLPSEPLNYRASVFANLPSSDHPSLIGLYQSKPYVFPCTADLPGMNIPPPPHGCPNVTVSMSHPGCPNVSLSPQLGQRLSSRSSLGSGRSNSLDDTDAFPGLAAEVLVVSHGGLLKELLRHLVSHFKVKLPGGKAHALRVCPNASVSRFMISLGDLMEGGPSAPAITCQLIHDCDHLASFSIDTTTLAV